MIDCTEKNIYKKRRNKLKSFIILFVCIVLIFLYYNYFVVGCVKSYCSDYIYKCVNDSINKAIKVVDFSKTDYNELINVEKDANGNVSYMSVNSYNVNKLSRSVCLLADDYIQSSLNSGILVPFFAFSGISFISGYGGKVGIKNLHIESVKCDLSNQFNSVGINQTLHAIYFDINCKISVNMPFKTWGNNFNTKVIVCESVLIGKVPEIYFENNLIK